MSLTDFSPPTWLTGSLKGDSGLLAILDGGTSLACLSFPTYIVEMYHSVVDLSVVSTESEPTF